MVPYLSVLSHCRLWFMDKGIQTKLALFLRAKCNHEWWSSVFSVGLLVCFEIGSLSKGVFERRTSNGSDVFFILKHLDATKFVFVSVFTIIEAICPKIWVIVYKTTVQKKGYFWLTWVAQKRLRLSSLIAPQSRKILQTFKRREQELVNQIPPTTTATTITQMSVKFRDFVELYLR